MPRVIFAITNDITSDQRVNRMARTLHQMGFEVEIVGVRRPYSLPFSPAYASTRRLPMWFQRKVFFYGEYNIRLFLRMLFAKADLLVANDLDTLPAMHLAARLRGIPLVYDTHEYYTGTPEVASRPPVFFVWKWIEDLLFRRQQTIITVNPSIAELYRQKYHKQLHVVRNVPHYQDPDVAAATRASLGLPAGGHLIVLQGSGINNDRGAEELILAMHPDHGIRNALLLIIGGGNIMPRLEQLVGKHQLQQQVRFLPRMPYQQMMAYTRQATIGASLDKDTSLNQRYSLPNKLFDYIMAGVPVLASDLPEVRRIVDTWQVGTITDSHHPADIARAIRTMLADPAQLQQWKQNCLQAARELNWEKEEQKVRAIYSKFL